MKSQKNQLSATNDVSLPMRRKFSVVALSGFLVPSRFFMKKRMVALEGEYGAGKRIEMTPNWESQVRFTKLKLLVVWPVV